MIINGEKIFTEYLCVYPMCLEPGILVFANPSIVVKESSMVVRIPVERLEGADGIVSVFWETKDLSAKNGIDYDGGHGELNFDSQEINRTINISLIQYEVSTIIIIYLLI